VPVEGLPLAAPKYLDLGGRKGVGVPFSEELFVDSFSGTLQLSADIGHACFAASQFSMRAAR
jgi:hypothetical protein